MIKRFIIVSSVLLLTVILWSCQNTPAPVTSVEPVPAVGDLTVASVTLPANATIVSANLYLYSGRITGQTVNIYRVTAPWTETTVTWNSFAGAFNPTVRGSFVVNTTGWIQTDITGLVNDWYMGTYPNYGLLLDQVIQEYPRAGFASKEYGSFQPYLEVSYSVSGNTELVTTLPLGDSYIWEVNPTANYGTSPYLYTGWESDTDLEKQSLIQFELLKEDIPESPGTGTPGYWMNHPEAWPVETITIGGHVYIRDQAIVYMMSPVRKDKTFTMFPALVAAKLNVLIGNESSCVADAIDAADDWMFVHPLQSGVSGSSDAWKAGEPLYLTLDNYNNGLLCAPHRD